MKFAQVLRPLSLAVLVCLTCGATNRPLQEKHREESLAFRHIMTLWKEDQRDTLPSLLDNYLEKFSKGAQREKVALMRAEIAFDAKDYATAHHYYQMVHTPRFRQAARPHLLYVLFRQKAYAELAKEVVPLKPIADNPLEKPEERLWLYYAAEAQRHLATEVKDAQTRMAQLRNLERDFQRLLESSLREHALRSLSSLYEAMGDLPKAVQVLRLCEDSGKLTRADALFQAAVLESRYDPEAACHAFGELFADSEGRATNALFNQVALLFTQGHYGEVVALAPEIQARLTADQAPDAYLFLGESLLEQGHSADALTILEQYVDAVDSHMTPDAQALFAGAMAAYQTENLASLNAFSQKLEQQPIDTTLLGKLRLMRALLCNRKDEPAAAFQWLRLIQTEHPELAQGDTVAFEQALALYHLHEWGQARQEFLSYVQERPESPLQDEAWSYLVDTTARLCDASKNDARALVQEALQLVEEGASRSEGDEERFAASTIHLSRALLRHGLAEEAMDALAPIVNGRLPRPLLAEAHYLMAYAACSHYHQLHSFIVHGEAALALAPQATHVERLHQELYLACIEMAKQETIAEGERDPFTGKTLSPLSRAELLDKAADHLYTLAQMDEEAIPIQNRLWLANHYYHRAMDFSPTDSLDEKPDPLTQKEAREVARRAITLYETIFEMADPIAQPPAMEITASTLHLEKDFFQMARLFQLLDRGEEATLILRYLRGQILHSPDLAWQRAPRVLLELSLACEKEGKKEEAIAILKELVQSVRDVAPYMVNYARLQMARLTFESVPVEKRTEESPKVQEALAALRELQTRRQLMSEPLHLEAAMDYALFRSSLEPEASRDEVLLALLNRAKQEFAETDSLHARAYHDARATHPDQDFIFQTYTMLFDARIAQIKSRLASAKGDTTEARQQSKAAQELFRTLTKEAFAVSGYLVAEAGQGLKELAEGNHSTQKARSGLEAASSTVKKPLAPQGI